MSLHEKFMLVKRKVLNRLNISDTGRLMRESWTLSWPIVLIMFFEFFMNLTDVYIAGLFSAEVKAATGLSSQVYSFFVMAGQALTVGTVSVVSRLFSTGDKEKFKTGVFTAVSSSCVAGLVLGTLGIIFAPSVVSLLNAPQEVRSSCISLLRIYSFGMFFHMVLINMNAVLRSCKLVKITMKIMVLAATLNIILNLAFMHFTPLGFKGIALSTVISIIVAFLIASKIIYNMVAHTYSYSWKLVKQMLSIGWPGAIVTLSWQFGGTALFVILALIPERSVEVMAAYTTGLRIEAAIFMPAFAFNMANAVIVGNLIGAKKYAEAYRAGMTTAVISVAVVSVMILVIILNARNIAEVLDKDILVIDEVMRYLYICLISEPFIALNLAMVGALSGAGDTKAVMRYALINVWAVRLPLAYLFGITLGWGSVGIWWALDLGFFIQAFLSYRRFKSGKWREVKLYD